MPVVPRAASAWPPDGHRSHEQTGRPCLLQRISSRAEFAQVLQKQAMAKTPHFVLHLSEGAFGKKPGSRIGCVIPKRCAKRAVTRNLIRRQIYTAAQAVEFWQQAPCDMVVRLRRSFSPSIFTSAGSMALKEQVRQEMQALFLNASSRWTATGVPS